jgi:TolB protein
MRPNGLDVTRIYAARGSNRTPAWSPDGEKIVFTSDEDGSDDIWVMDADGSNPVNLTSTPGFEEDTPDWRPLPN